MITLYILDLETKEGREYLHDLNIHIITMNTNNSIAEPIMTPAKEKIEHFHAKIKVTVHIPQDISPNIKQQKINQIYDILGPKRKERNIYEQNNGYLCTAFC